jgi:protein-disulfide isomerase
MVSKKKVKKYDFVGKIKKNPWKFMTFVFAVFSIVLMVSMVIGDSSNVSSKKAGENFVDYINSMSTSKIEYVDSQDFSDGLYEVTVLAQGQEIPVHVTKDGKYYVQGVMPITSQMINEPKVEETKSQNIIKSDKPLVQLFVMTHCPYGTQAEKGFLPMARLLEDVADMEIRFVHYFMHEPEETETPRQVCIREEQGDKFLDYLECFLEGDGNSEGGYITNGNDPSICMQEVGIDESAVQDCVDSGRWEEYYAEDSQMSEEAGVRGSPTLVINGVIVSAGRSEAAYLEASCEAFNDAPELCQEEVSTATPSVYFGWEETSNTASAAGAC